VGIAAAALAAFNPFLLWYSQEARSYSLLVLLATASLYLFARLLNRPSRTAFALWGLVSALALATHYFAIFLIVPEGLWLIAAGVPRRHALVACGGVVLAGLALLPLALDQRSHSYLTDYLRDTTMPFRLLRTAKQQLIGFDLPAEVALTLVAGGIAASGAALAVLRLKGDERNGARVAGALALVAAVAPVLLALLGLDYIDPRNMLVVWMPVAIVVAAGLVGAAGRTGAAAVAVLCVLGILSVAGLFANPNWRRPDWRGAAAAVGAPREPTVIVQTPENNEQPLMFYLGDSARLRPAGARVRDVTLALRARLDPKELHPAAPPRPPSVRISGFSEVGRRETETYTVIRVRSTREVRLTPARLRRLDLVPGETESFLLRRAGRAYP
jgi:mannosyltransferase